MKKTVSRIGVYSLPELSRLIDIKPDRARRWFNGKGGRGGKCKVAPIFEPDYEREGQATRLSFYNLIDALIASKLYDNGVGMQTIRRVYDRLEQDYEMPHPFCGNQLMTDGALVFLYIKEDDGEELVEVLEKQRFFPKVMKPVLSKIEYDEETKLATRWNIARGVIVDPEIHAGQPHLLGTVYATETIATAYQANHEDVGLVARWYGISPSKVKTAAEFELKLAA